MDIFTLIGTVIIIVMIPVVIGYGLWFIFGEPKMT